MIREIIPLFFIVVATLAHAVPDIERLASGAHP